MHDAYSTRVRKTKRRQPPPRTRTRALDARQRAVTRASTTSTPSEPHDSPEPNPPPKPHVWVPDDFVAMASETRAHRSVEFERFFGGSHPKLPPQLQRKPRGDVIALMRRLATVCDAVPQFGLPRCHYALFMAVLAAELRFLTDQKSRRDAAVTTFTNARSERRRIEQQRLKLAAEGKALEEQMRSERSAITKMSQRKAATDSSLVSMRERYHQLRNKYKLLGETLCRSKLSELDTRRRLDRQQLKISALLGDVIIPTLDTLSESQPVWLADTHIPLASERERDAVAPAHTAAQQPNIPERTGSPFIGYNAILHESKEDQQLRLLKYRLRMCEMETAEWRETLACERERIRLITRAKSTLEEHVQRQKQANRDGQHSKMTSTAARLSPKSSGQGIKTIARIRSAVRSSFNVTGEGGAGGGATKVITKSSRKGRAVRSLTRLVEEWT